MQFFEHICFLAVCVACYADYANTEASTRYLAKLVLALLATGACPCVSTSKTPLSTIGNPVAQLTCAEVHVSPVTDEVADLDLEDIGIMRIGRIFIQVRL